MVNLHARWHGIPVYAIGGIVLVSGGYVVYRRRKAAALAAAGGTNSPSTLSVDGSGPSGGGGSGSGADASGVNSLLSKLQDFMTGQQAFQQAQAANSQKFLQDQEASDQSFLQKVTDLLAASNKPAPTGAPPANTVGAGTPSDTYSLGQVVNAASGEKVINQVWSPVYGWLNQTNTGGIYTGGGGSQGIGGLSYGGSYLGYASQRYGVGTPDAAQELATHGQFGPGGLVLLPGGGYREVNNRGESYNFGA